MNATRLAQIKVYVTGSSNYYATHPELPDKCISLRSGRRRTLPEKAKPTNPLDLPVETFDRMVALLEKEIDP